MFDFTRIVDPSNWPDEKEQLALYGNEEVDYMIDHFSEILSEHKCDFDSAKREWSRLKFGII